MKLVTNGSKLQLTQTMTMMILTYSILPRNLSRFSHVATRSTFVA